MVKNMTLVFGIIALVELIVIGVLCVGMFIEKRNIHRVIKQAELLAQKNIDLDDVIFRHGDDDMRILVNSVNVIKSNLMSFIEATRGNVITLSEAVERLSCAAHTNEAGSEETTNSIQVVADKAREQLALVRDNLRLIEMNDKELDIINDSITNIRKSLDTSAKCCQNGIKSLEAYENDMNVISQNLNKSTEVLYEFNNQIVEINSIKEMVVDISEQLRLLAFNASIEAAKAGESGKGFSVVSVEMKNMSDQTMDSMNAINDILAKITESSELVTSSITKCDETFQQSSELFDEVSNSFRELSTQSLEVNDMMVDMSKTFKTIANNSDQSKLKAESVFAASEVISDSTKGIVEATAANNQDSAKMTENVNMLEDMMKNISSVIKQFNTGVKPVDKNRDKIVRIAFYSMLDNYFWYGIKRGVNYAQKELANNNVEIIYYSYENRDAEARFPGDVKRSVDTKVDAILYPGFMHGADKEMKEAAAAGIKIFTYNCDCDSNIKRVSCYEPDQQEAGELAAKATIKALGGEGNVAIVCGEKVVPVNQIRYDSYINYINKYAKNINIVATVDVVNDPPKTYQQIYDCLMTHPEVDMIFSTTGMQKQLVQAIEDTGKTGRVRAVVFDKNEEIFGYIKRGIVAAAIDHDPFNQGYYPIIMMYNHIVDNMHLSSDRVKCRASVVTNENLGEQVIM